jgi:hypothetical protein
MNGAQGAHIPVLAQSSGFHGTLFKLTTSQ